MALETAEAEGQGRNFFEAFGVGVEGAPPHPIDIGGVTYAAIQALYEMTKRSRSALDELQSRMEQAGEHQAGLRRKLEQMRRP